jgi:hypothetical protein
MAAGEVRVFNIVVIPSEAGTAIATSTVAGLEIDTVPGNNTVVSETTVLAGECQSAAACPDADVNCDDVADGFDVAVVRRTDNWLLSANDAADPRADVNGDGVIDGFDVAVIRRTDCWLQ